ncbi:MAG: MCE family protein [Deltaproteobacteria bacterium]|nr:MCE family protein [Deltaproteobacteria bacterium]
MIKLTSEAKVGLFVILGILLLVYMSLKIGGVRIGKSDGYELFVRFDSVAGLDKDSSVRVAGVEIGRVKQITLDGNKAKLTLMVKKDTRIGADFVAVLTTQGVLGERYLELIPGSPNAPLIEPGGTITRTQQYIDLEKFITILGDAAADIKEVSSSLAGVFGGVAGERNLRDIVVNLGELTRRMNRIVAANEERIGRTLGNFEIFSRLLKDDGPGIVDGLRNITDEFNSFIAENRDSLQGSIRSFEQASLKLEETMDTVNKMVMNVEPKIDESFSRVTSIADKIDRGEGTLGKLVNDPETHDNFNKALTGINSTIGRIESFKTFLSYRAEYLTDVEETKSYFSLKLQPKADRYYLIEVIDDPTGARSVETKVTTTGGTTTTVNEVTITDDFKFSAQVARRFGGLTLRGGLLESTGGVGMDYHLWDDKIRFTFDAFDFDQTRNPHLKAGLSYSFAKFFFLSGGYDDFVSKVDLESYYVGGGFTLEDDDIKYILGSVPIPQ